MAVPHEVKLARHALDLDDDGHDTHFAASVGGMVPYYIAPGDTFTVPLYKQALFSMLIDNAGTLDVQGFLVEVD